MDGLIIERKLTFATPRRPQRREEPTPRGRVPRVARLLALGHRIERLVRDGHVPDYATVANVGGVSRARVAQVVALTNLAPDIQEAILFLPPITSGKDPISEHDLRPIAAQLDWKRQRRMWREMRFLNNV